MHGQYIDGEGEPILPEEKDFHKYLIKEEI